MAKLGQQIQQQQQAEQQQRASRAQRVQAQEEQVKFEGLKVEAQKVQEEKFKDKVVSREETYFEYRPKEYSEKEWSRMKESTKQAILRQYERGRGLDYYADRGVLVRTSNTRTVSETIPFTLDEGSNSYENIYSNLAPELKQFFAPPEQLKEERSQRIQSNISRVDERIEMAKIRLRELDEKYQQKKQELQEWWQRKSSKYRDDPRNRENYKENLRDLENDYEEDTEEQRGVVEGLSKGRGELSSKKDIDFDAIVNYANDLGNYFQERKEAKNQNREVERNALKALEEKNKKAQEKGFTFTGVITKSFVDPKTKKETVQGRKFYLGGAEVAPTAFAKQFDIYSKPTGDTLIVPKGTDLAKLTPEQQQKLFPMEYEKARQQSLSEQRAEAQAISSLSLATPEQAPAKASFFSKAKTTVGKGFGFAGDIVGSILPDVFGSGSRGLEQTTISEGELLTRREKIKDLGFNIASLGLFSISGGGAVTGFGGKSPTIIEADIESFKLRRDIAGGADEAKDLQKVIGFQVEEITKAQGSLQKIDQGVTTGEISFDEAKSQRFGIYQDLASKGVRTKIDIDENEGVENLTFTSPELEKDFASAYAKEFRTKTSGQRKVAIAGSITGEVLEGAIVGLALGGTGVLAKVGTGLSKIPGVSTVITKFPTASKLALEGTFFGTTLAVSGLQSYRTGQEFKQQGLNASEGYLLGFGIPAGKAIGFYGGAKIGTKFYTQNILAKVERGGFTKTVMKDVEFRGKKGKLPAEARQITEVSAGDKKLSSTAQASIKETKIPGTEIKISQQDYLKGRYRGQKGFEAGEVFTKVTRGQAPIIKGSTGQAKTFFIKPEGQDQTGIVAVSKAKGGVNVDMYRTGVKNTDIKILKEFDDGARLYTMDFKRPITKVGETVFVKGASLNDLTKVRGVIDTNRLFTSFAGEDRLFAVARTRQLVFEGTPKMTGYFDTTTGSPETVKQIISVGSTKSGRIDALKFLLKDYGISAKEQSQVFSLLANKRGQTSLFTGFSAPSVTTAPPQNVQIGKLLELQDASTLVLPNVIKDLAPTIRSDIALRSLLGVSFLSGTGIRSKPASRTRQQTLQSQLQNLLQINIQQQQPAQQQRQQQSQQQNQLQQQLQQQLQIIPITTPTPTPTPSGAGGFALPDFDLEFFDAVKKKAGRKRQRKDLAYVQDFTSKIIGFEPTQVSEKQAQKLARQTQTGFEIRMPIVIRGSSQSKDAKRLKKLLAQ